MDDKPGSPARRPPPADRRPRVALVDTSCPDVDELCEIAGAFRSAGADVDVFASEPIPETLGRSLRGAHRVGRTGSPDEDEREVAAIAGNEALRDALHTHGPFDAVYERHAPWSHAALDYAADRDIPSVLELCSPEAAEPPRARSRHRALAEAILVRVFGSVGEVVISPDAVTGHLRRRWGGPGEPEDLPPPSGTETTVYRVGFVGRLDSGVGLLDLVDAFGLLQEHRPRSRLVLVGDGPEASMIRAELDRRELLPCLEHVPEPPRGDLPALLGGLDVAVAPFPTAGAMGLAPFKVVEYMAAGVAVVASRIRPLLGIVQDGVTGYTFEPRDVTFLSAALRTLAEEPGLRSHMARMGQQQLRRPLDRGEIAARLLETVRRGGRDDEDEAPGSLSATVGARRA